MVENLRTTKYNDSTAIQYNERWGGEAPACYCWYNNDTANKVAYGALYSWYAVNTGKLAPTGWHVPTDAEWTILENFLMTNSYNYDGTTTGNKIAKALSSPTGWHSSTITGSVGNTDYPEKCNTTGFTALPVGGREQQENNWASGKFLGFGYSGYWWSSSETVPQIYGAHGRGLEYDKILLINFQTRREWGFSVRCLRD